MRESKRQRTRGGGDERKQETKNERWGGGMRESKRQRTRGGDERKQESKNERGGGG